MLLTKKTCHSSISPIRQRWLIGQENLRPEAQILGMKPKVCCRPPATIAKVLFIKFII